MATIHVDEIFILGLTDEINSVKYEASFNEDFSDPFHEEEKEIGDMFNSYFTIRNDDDSIYFGNDKVYTRFNIKVSDTYVGWYENNATQNNVINALSDEDKESLRKKLLEFNIV